MARSISAQRSGPGVWRRSRPWTSAAKSGWSGVSRKAIVPSSALVVASWREGSARRAVRVKAADGLRGPAVAPLLDAHHQAFDVVLLGDRHELIDDPAHEAV